MADVPGTTADGNVKIAFVPTIADPAAPTATELTAVGVKDLSCYLTSDGWTPGLDEQVVSDERLCSTQTFEKRGRNSRTLSIKYVENPTEPTDNVAYTTLAPGTTGFLVERRGAAYSGAFAADDVVNVWPIEAGEYDPQPPEANSVLKVAQKAFVTGTVQMGKTVVAGA
jgi:hypothetical protein